MEKLIRTCNFCEIEFETYHPTADYCSRSHKERAREQRKRNRDYLNANSFCPIVTSQCAFCGGVYVQRRAISLYCSKQCKGSKKQEQRRQRDLKLNTRLRGVKQTIFFRDKGLCQICYKQVLLTDRHPHPLSLSIDHVVPVSKGGAHAMHNLQLAHLSCNIMKSNHVDYVYKDVD